MPVMRYQVQLHILQSKARHTLSKSLLRSTWKSILEVEIIDFNLAEELAFSVDSLSQVVYLVCANHLKQADKFIGWLLKLLL